MPASQIRSASLPRYTTTRPAATGLWTTILRMIALRRQRRQLAELDAHLLDDIGVSRDEALTEAARPVWDAPAHWMKK